MIIIYTAAWQGKGRNALTSHLCTYVLASITSGRDLLLAMRDVHARLRQTQDGLTPPLFKYEESSQPGSLVLIYDSPRNICPLLWGGYRRSGGTLWRAGTHR